MRSPRASTASTHPSICRVVRLQLQPVPGRRRRTGVFHTGLRAMFPLVSEAIGAVMAIERLRYVGFSHVEADECGSLNQLRAVAPAAVPLCSQVAAMVSITD